MLLGNSDDDGSRCDCQPFHNKRIHKKDEDGFEKRGVTVSFQVIFLVALVVVVLLVQDLTNMSSFLPVFTRLLLLFVVVLHKNKKVRSTCRFCGSNQSNCRLILLHMHLILPTICLCLSVCLCLSLSLLLPRVLGPFSFFGRRVYPDNNNKRKQKRYRLNPLKRKSNSYR